MKFIFSCFRFLFGLVFVFVSLGVVFCLIAFFVLSVLLIFVYVDVLYGFLRFSPNSEANWGSYVSEKRKI